MDKSLQTCGGKDAHGHGWTCAPPGPGDSELLPDCSWEEVSGDTGHFKVCCQTEVGWPASGALTHVPPSGVHGLKGLLKASSGEGSSQGPGYF